MGNAGQNQEQGQFTEPLLTEGASDAKIGGYLLERIEEAEDGAAGRLGCRGRQIEFPAQQTTQSGDTGSRPGGNVGDGPVPDLAVFTERLTEQNGGRRVAVWDLRYIHNYKISQKIQLI